MMIEILLVGIWFLLAAAFLIWQFATGDLNRPDRPATGAESKPILTLPARRSADKAAPSPEHRRAS